MIFQTASQEKLFDLTISGLEKVGYSNGLLELNYKFPDYFEDGVPVKQIPAVAFGQTPVSYKTACFGVVIADQNGKQGRPLVSTYRWLAAPFQFEIRDDRVVRWAVGRDDNSTSIVAEYNKSELEIAFRENAAAWSPSSMLRAKNIGLQQIPRQLDLFLDSGLVPALEEQIEYRLDPILKNALSAARRTFREVTGDEPDERDLFRLVFRLLSREDFP
ncbi:MAG: hypothetical protein U0744_02450 [Gemmataceae bacterium]